MQINTMNTRRHVYFITFPVLVILLIKLNIEWNKTPRYLSINNSEILITRCKIKVQSRNLAVLYSVYARSVDHVLTPTYLLAHYLCYEVTLQEK